MLQGPIHPGDAHEDCTMAAFLQHLQGDATGGISGVRCGVSCGGRWFRRGWHAGLLR
jgi:hypothetical protein